MCWNKLWGEGHSSNSPHHYATSLNSLSFNMMVRDILGKKSH
eukprot:CAMPEP_0174380518 /NCGR_PEP_ID=MMETSP0811_2-20130205/123432_1 /TAXON_ID=73025 ORGANISM="Eutreptiella gymnastica-like, Strain CCMP1594" /NCGR_SAMPLE_ID=MMETSP0811_2 /ASSEMBLY_ACC=CAM_ASM_000667 /LENGTH=41 /DNA_ID= /DNA_START= /DNA_END= /DNA_ORIENTATION=